MRHSNVYYIIKLRLELSKNRYFQRNKSQISLFSPTYGLIFSPYSPLFIFFCFHVDFDKTLLIAGSVTN